MTGVGLYVHVPFCPSKCGYCDFYSIVPEPDVIDPFVTALLAELERALNTPAVRVETLFVGGGTPTLLPVAALERLIAALGCVAAEHGVSEFTIEANPATLDDAKARLLRQHGVTRMSMGAQSFDAGELRTLGRIHKPKDITESAGVVRRVGFDHFNLDLIFGIPGQTLATWTASLRQAVDLGPDHLACYGLTAEPGTPFRRSLDTGLVTPMDESLQAELYLAAIDQLAAAGFEHYEISNFARPGPAGTGRCLHNLRYWWNRPGIGIGPSAASYLSGRRWRNVPDAAEYVRRIRAGQDIAIESETLSPAARAGETAMLRMRLMEGIDACEFRRDTGLDPFDLFAAPIASHTEAGRLLARDGRIALTRAGLLVADAVLADFLIPDPPESAPPFPAGHA